jgi:hypothetical protein
MSRSLHRTSLVSSLTKYLIRPSPRQRHSNHQLDRKRRSRVRPMLLKRENTGLRGYGKVTAEDPSLLRSAAHADDVRGNIPDLEG